MEELLRYFRRVSARECRESLPRASREPSPSYLVSASRACPGPEGPNAPAGGPRAQSVDLGDPHEILELCKHRIFWQALRGGWSVFQLS